VSYEFMKLLYGDHPYGRLTGGDTLSLPLIKREDLLAFHNTHFRPTTASSSRRATSAARSSWRSWRSGSARGHPRRTRAHRGSAHDADRIRAKVITRSA